MAVTMVRDFSGRGEIGSRRLQSNEPQKEMKLGGDVERPEFSDLVKDFAKDVNDLQLQAGNAIDMLATGQAADVHQVMVAVEEAGIARDLMLEIRNRVLEGYQELIRMQV
jgi:flagellar hook-basal body complex protein FliE